MERWEHCKSKVGAAAELSQGDVQTKPVPLHDVAWAGGVGNRRITATGTGIGSEVHRRRSVTASGIMPDRPLQVGLSSSGSTVLRRHYR